jgi:hypothetical protein
LIRQAIDRQAGSVAAPFVSDAGAWSEMVRNCRRSSAHD